MTERQVALFGSIGLLLVNFKRFHPLTAGIRPKFMPGGGGHGFNKGRALDLNIK